MNRRFLLGLLGALMFCLVVNFWYKKYTAKPNEISIKNEEFSVEDIEKHKRLIENILTIEDNGLKTMEAIKGKIELDHLKKGIQDANNYLLQTIDELGLNITGRKK